VENYSRDKALDVVEAGYDRLTELYSRERERFGNWNEINAFLTRLPQKAKVLDAGCGTGVPVAKKLSQNGFEVVGVDISKNMVQTARKNVPNGTFFKMNMTDLSFPADSFDGIISCYAIIHNPKESHADIFRSFYRVLKPGGIMLVSVASWEWEEFADYLGVDMFWSHFDPDKTKSLITDAGFEIEFGRNVTNGGETHHWILAHKR